MSYFGPQGVHSPQYQTMHITGQACSNRYCDQCELLRPGGDRQPRVGQLMLNPHTGRPLINPLTGEQARNSHPSHVMVDQNTGRKHTPIEVWGGLAQRKLNSRRGVIQQEQPDPVRHRRKSETTRITSALLREAQAVVLAGGGRAAFAKRKGIDRSTLQKYLNTDGTLTRLGNRLLNVIPKHKEITKSVFEAAQEWVKKGKSRSAFATQGGYSASSIISYVDQNGNPTQSGIHRFDSSHHYNKITEAIVVEAKQFRRSGGSIKAFCQKRNISSTHLWRKLK